MRQGEILALKWSDIDLESKKISVTRSIRKVKILIKMVLLKEFLQSSQQNLNHQLELYQFL
jgi:integrase